MGSIPRGVLTGMRRPRCAALDQNGRQCRASLGLKPVHYHGDDELYGFCSGSREPGWVVVYLCAAHRKEGQ